jgi:hypothetical protein
MSQRCKEWKYDETNEAWLRTLDIGSVSITQHTYRKSLLLLKISLLEKFFKKQICPFFGGIK